jgi:hypothetical protein
MGQHPKQIVKFEHKVTFFFNCISKFGKLSAFKINKKYTHSEVWLSDWMSNRPRYDPNSK